MKVLILLVTLVVSSSWAQETFARQQSSQPRYEERQPESRPSEYSTPIPILRFDKEQSGDGSYKTLWETGNHILAQEEGYLKDLGPDPDKEGEELQGQVQQGSYSYTSPDGQIITVSYIADEKGFHPSGDHLPTPPPVSPEIQKGLDLIFAGIQAREEEEARNPPQDGRKANLIPEDGQYRRQ